MTRSREQSERHRTRQGSSLLEVVIVMTVTAMMLTPVLAMLHLILGAERNTARELRESLLLSRIAEQFRRDVHAAVDSRLISARPDRSVEELSLTLPGRRTIDYRHDTGRLTRTVTESGRRIQQDRFVFREGSTIRFAQEPKLHLVAITITRPRRANSTAPRTATPAKDRAVGKAAVTRDGLRSPIAAPKPSRADHSAVERRAIPDSPPPRHVIRFEAVLGSDHRFQKKVSNTPDKSGG